MSTRALVSRPSRRPVMQPSSSFDGGSSRRSLPLPLSSFDDVMPRKSSLLSRWSGYKPSQWSAWMPLSSVVAFALLIFNALLFGISISNIVAPVPFASVSTFRWVVLAYSIVISVAAVFDTLLMIFDKKANDQVKQRAMLQLSFTVLFWILYFMLAEYAAVIGKSRDTFDFYAISHFALAITTFHFAGLQYAANEHAYTQPVKNSVFVVIVYVMMVLTLLYAMSLAYVSFAEVLGSEIASARTQWIMTAILFLALVLTVFVNAIAPGKSKDTGLYAVISAAGVLVAPVLLFLEVDRDSDSDRAVPLQYGAAAVPYTAGAPWLMTNTLSSVAYYFVAMLVSYPVVGGFAKEAPTVRDYKRESAWRIVEMVLAVGSTVASLIISIFCVLAFVPGKTSGITPVTLFWIMLAKMIWDVALLVSAIVGAAQHKSVYNHMQRIWLAIFAVLFSVTIFWDVSVWWADNDGSDITSAGWKANALFCGLYGLMNASATSMIVNIIRDKISQDGKPL